eukprot:TRINITY_DN8871_c0_g2_i2.p1 TRINITY_DN8871_c0_g2~~TRINITY_DN8871_c0_g2_i2.p1  ORF type:complete len:313 (+),score=60.16 TRINITY_DN8871_c0_g2_i2:118-1056(+)
MPGSQLQKAQQWSRNHPVAASLMAGAVSGGTAKTVTAPMDRLKLLFQVGKLPLTVKNLQRLAIDLYREEGFVNLWRGNSATLARVLPYAAIQFTAHEQYKLWLRRVTGCRDLEAGPRFAAGALAGATAVSFTYPLDLVRAQLAIQTRLKLKHSGPGHALVSIWQQEGVFGLYRGIMPTMLGVIPYAGTSFFTYETIKLQLRRSQMHHGSELAPSADKDLTSLERLSAGALAGLVGQSVTYPLDVVRRRMQTDGVFHGHRPSAMATLRLVVQQHGISGLYRGLALNWIKGPIAVSISFTIFDFCKNTFQFKQS